MGVGSQGEVPFCRAICVRLVLSTGLIHPLYRIWIDRSMGIPILLVHHATLPRTHPSIVCIRGINSLFLFSFVSSFFSLLPSLSIHFTPYYPLLPLITPHVPLNNGLPNVLQLLQQQPIPSRFLLLHRQPQTTSLVPPFTPLKVALPPRLSFFHATSTLLRQQQFNPPPSTLDPVPSHHSLHSLVLPFLTLRHPLKCRSSCSRSLQTHFSF